MSAETMTTPSELLEVAAEYQRGRQWDEAAQFFAVAADAFEALATSYIDRLSARDARRQMRRMLVYRWVEREHPEHLDNVEVDFGYTGRGETRTFHALTLPTIEQIVESMDHDVPPPRTWSAIVRVDNLGRVRRVPRSARRRGR